MHLHAELLEVVSLYQRRSLHDVGAQPEALARLNRDGVLVSGHHFHLPAKDDDLGVYSMFIKP